MGIEIKEVKTKNDLRTYIYLPAKIHKSHSNWLPPVYMDEWLFYNTKKNKCFSFSDTIILLAYRNGEPVGRIMGIINKKYNEKKGIRQGRFSFLECYNDPEISHALISFIENWVRDKGMTQIIGPYGFSDKDPQGLMIEGFDVLPVIAAPTNEEYMVKLVEKEGYTKEVDCLHYLYDLSKELPPVYEKVYERFLQKPGFKLREFRSKKELKPYIVPILTLMNESFKEIYGHIPMDIQEMKDFASRYMAIIDPRFVKTIAHNDKEVAFLLSIPSLTKGIQKAKGKLFPFGFFHILQNAKKSKHLDLMLGSVHPDYLNLGLIGVLITRTQKVSRDAGYEELESHLVLETNKPMSNIMGHLGATTRKRYRVYQKSLI
jgi:hypothetical protein